MKVKGLTMFKKFKEILGITLQYNINSKLNSFSKHSLEIIYEQLDYIKNESARFLEIHRQTLEKFQQSKNLEKDETQKEQFFALSREVIQSIQVSNTREWYEKNCLFLVENTKWWNECIAKLILSSKNEQQIKEVKEIEKLQSFWQQQGHYAVFSTPDLIGVYWRNAGVIGQWLKSAQQEFKAKRKQLSKKVANKYREQLNNLETAFQAEKTQIRAALLARLSIGIKRGDLYFDDLVISTVQQLEQVSAITPMRLPKGIRRHITPSILRYIQQIIGIDGTQEEKAQLANVLYAQPNASLSLRTNPFGITFAVPQAVANIVAVKPPFYTKLPKGLQFLFRGEKASYKFFQHKSCQYLLIAAQHLIKHEIEVGITAATLRHSTSWRYFNQLMHLLASELKRQQGYQANFSSILYSDVHQLLADYKTTLSTFAQTLFNKQLQIFDQLLTDLEVQIKTRSLTEIELLEIEAVKTKLTDFQNTWGTQIPKEQRNLLARYLLIKDTVFQPPIADEVFEQATQATQKIKKGQTVTKHEKAVLKTLEEVSSTVSTTVSIANDTYAKATAVLHYRVTQENVKKLLKIELEKAALKLTSPELIEHLQTIKQQFESITLIEPAFISSAEMQTAIYRYVYNLLTTIQNLSGRSAFTKLEGHTQFILKTLLQLPIDDVLRQLIERCAKAIETFKALDWDLFCQLAITPNVNALSDVLNTDIVIVVPEAISNKTINQTSELSSVINEPVNELIKENMELVRPIYTF